MDVSNGVVDFKARLEESSCDHVGELLRNLPMGPFHGVSRVRADFFLAVLRTSSASRAAPEPRLPVASLIYKERMLAWNAWSSSF